MAIPLPGEPPVVVLLGQRAAYLKDGVIDPERYEPGDLTRSLCSPWQYDFTDCGCWYWASNKPDMVAVTPDGPQIYNFQRLRTGEIAPEPPTHPPVVSQQLWGRGHAAGTPVSPEERVPRQMNHADLITGWEVLPVVIDDRETDRMVARPAVTLPDSELFLDLATIVDRLVYLAGIEHALMIEYLYAHYSIDSSRRRPAPDDTGPLRLFEAANTILSVAIDEMRHFRWVNEILVMLGQPPAVRRALRTEDKDNNGRFFGPRLLANPSQPGADRLVHPDRAGSQDVDPGVQSDTIDGMYTRLLLSIERSDEIADEIKERVQHLIKLIIDEGYEHYHRFQRVRQLLPQPPDESYLRILEDPQPLADTHPAKGLEDRVNRSYEVILNLLLVLFGRGDAEHGQLLEATRIAMVDSLDMESLNLILAGGAPLFVLPDLSSEVNLGLFSAGPGLAGLPGPMVARTAGDAAGPRPLYATPPAPRCGERDRFGFERSRSPADGGTLCRRHVTGARSLPDDDPRRRRVGRVSRRHAVVLGGGLVGLTSTRILLDCGWSVRLCRSGLRQSRPIVLAEHSWKILEDIWQCRLLRLCRHHLLSGRSVRWTPDAPVDEVPIASLSLDAAELSEALESRLRAQRGNGLAIEDVPDDADLPGHAVVIDARGAPAPDVCQMVCGRRAIRTWPNLPADPTLTGRSRVASRPWVLDFSPSDGSGSDERSDRNADGGARPERGCFRVIGTRGRCALSRSNCYRKRRRTPCKTKRCTGDRPAARSDGVHTYAVFSRRPGDDV